MSGMARQHVYREIMACLRPGMVMLAIFTVIFGVGYSLSMAALIDNGFAAQTEGSLLRDASGRVIASTVTATTVGKPEYFQGGTRLDPTISLDAALAQVSRIAAQRHMSAFRLRELIDRSTRNSTYNTTRGLYVNLLELNLRLDGKLE